MWAVKKMFLNIDHDLYQIVIEKFDKCLQQFCEEENIKIKIWSDIKELNISLYDYYDENTGASAVYHWKRDSETKKQIYDDEFPCIHLSENYIPYTFAHEIGHHLALKNFNDRSEYIADAFILILAEEYLTDIEREIISLGLKAFSGMEFPKITVKRKDWKNFKKEHKYNHRRRKITEN
jgi:hypothetical protein